VHRDCLIALLRFLALVAANHESNKMHLSNLAVVFAPTLFYIKLVCLCDIAPLICCPGDTRASKCSRK
jgi:hypothetical protein